MKNRALLLLLVIVTIFALAGCTQSSPSAVVKKFYDYVDKGQFDKAAALFSQRALSQFGIAKIEALIEMQKQGFDSLGGVKSYRITKETIIKDQANVVVELTLGNGTVQSVPVSLVKEDKDWRISAGK